MIAMLAVFVLLYSGLLGCWAVWCAARGTTLGLGYLGGLVLLELTLLVRAGIELARLVTASGGPHGEFGRGYAEPGVHAGYLLASIVVLPLVLTVTRTSRALTSSDGPAELGGDDQPVGRPLDQSARRSDPESPTGAGNGSTPDPARGTEHDTALEIEPVVVAETVAAQENTARYATAPGLAPRREATWDALVAAVGCVAVAVVTIRMGMTGRPA
jgi:hypothetical protein